MSIILELHHCRVHKHWNDIGSKGGNLEFFRDFRQKDKKSTRGPSVNSWSTSTLEGQRVKGEVPGMKHKRIPEVWSKVNFGQLRGSWSKSKASQLCDLSLKRSKVIKEYVRYGEVTPSLFLLFAPYRILPPTLH